MRRFIIGDIHGNYEGLNKILDAVKFSDDDILYSVGDFCDRGTENIKVLKTLMSLSNFKSVRGNHDVWLYNFLYCTLNGKRIDYEAFNIWTGYNGGRFTYNELLTLDESELLTIFNFLKKFKQALVEDDFALVHGGLLKGMTINSLKELEKEEVNGYDHSNWSPYNVVWDREYFMSASYPDKVIKDRIIDPINIGRTLIIGHTPIKDGPFISEKYNLINMDTGSGKGGKISLLNIDSRESISF